ncbi:MAG: hypothetical protein WC375_09070, partial [Methanomassiliicoccales archaeon]
MAEHKSYHDKLDACNCEHCHLSKVVGEISQRSSASERKAIETIWDRMICAETEMEWLKNRAKAGESVFLSGKTYIEYEDIYAKPELKFSPYDPSCENKMDMYEWVNEVINGQLIDDDGVGYWATDKIFKSPDGIIEGAGFRVSNLNVSPLDVNNDDGTIRDMP